MVLFSLVVLVAWTGVFVQYDVLEVLGSLRVTAVRSRT